MVVCVFFFSTDNDLLINRWVNVETADADGTWEGWFVGTIINYNKQSKQYTISFDDFDSTHNIVVPGDEFRKWSLCSSLNLSILSLNSLSSSAIRTVCHGRKTFWLAPPGVAQLSDLVLEGTSFSIKKQGTTVKRNEAYFMLLFFFLTVRFSFIGAFWIPLRLFPTLLV